MDIITFTALYGISPKQKAADTSKEKAKKVAHFSAKKSRQSRLRRRHLAARHIRCETLNHKNGNDSCFSNKKDSSKTIDITSLTLEEALDNIEALSIDVSVPVSITDTLIALLPDRTLPYNRLPD